MFQWNSLLYCYLLNFTLPCDVAFLYYYIGNVSSIARKLSILDAVSPLQDVILLYKLYICGVNVNKVNKGSKLTHFYVNLSFRGHVYGGKRAEG